MKSYLTTLSILMSFGFLTLSPVRSITGVEFAMVGAAANVGAYVKDFLEGVRTQLKTEKGREAAMRWVIGCASSCWRVCREPSLAEQFVPKEDIDAGLRPYVQKTFQELQRLSVATSLSKELGVAEFILKKRERHKNEYTTLLEAVEQEQVKSPIFYVGFFVKPNRRIPQERLAEWGENQNSFLEEVQGDFNYLGVKVSLDQIRKWVKDSNIVEVAKTCTKIWIEDPIMAYAFGSVGGIGGTSLEAPLIMVIIRESMSPVSNQPHGSQEVIDYQHLLCKKTDETEEAWYEYLGQISPSLKAFKEKVFKDLVFPKKRETEEESPLLM
jgi:hypothetical protein